MQPFRRGEVQDLIELALREDLPRGDITSLLALPRGISSEARIVAREDQVVCGVRLLPEIIKAYCRLQRRSARAIRIKREAREGSSVRRAAVLAHLQGDARDLLALERTLLNFLQRMGGVATFTHAVVRRAAGIRVLDTRKTLPGWRVLDKYAVATGGGSNHRGNLSEMVLVKNNHIDGGGGVVPTLERVMKGKPRGMKVEVEVRDLAELQQAIPFRPNIIMLDNFNLAGIRRALKILAPHRGKIEVEVSGGVSPRRLKALRRVGVRLVSMGALTTQARNVDISMRIVLKKKPNRVVS